VAPTGDGWRTRSATVDVEACGGAIARYGLVLVLLWIGAIKFTTYEANARQDLGASSLLRSWTYGVFGVQALSSLIGITLLAIAGLIAARPFSA